MKKTIGKENELTNDTLEKKKTVKYAAIFSIVIILVFSVIWFGGEWMAPESVISTATITMNGKSHILQFSEKTSGRNRDYQGAAGESGIRNYAYYLKLIDPINKVTLSSVRFKSPVVNIQNRPAMSITDTTVWIVSTTNSSDRERKGFILKFSIKEETIREVDFVLDDTYRVRKLDGDKVFLTAGEEPYVSKQAHYYLDLKSGKIEDR